MSTRASGVVVDGAGLPTHLRAGCHHGVSWYADRLATCMGDTMVVQGDLRGALREALEIAAAAHGSSCDLATGSPSGTIAAWRTWGERVEVIVLGDASAFLRMRDRRTRRLTDGASTSWSNRSWTRCPRREEPRTRFATCAAAPSNSTAIDRTVSGAAITTRPPPRRRSCSPYLATS